MTSFQIIHEVDSFLKPNLGNSYLTHLTQADQLQQLNSDSFRVVVHHCCNYFRLGIRHSAGTAACPDSNCTGRYRALHLHCPRDKSCTFQAEEVVVHDRTHLIPAEVAAIPEAVGNTDQ